MNTILPKISAGNTGALYGNNRLYTGREYDKESGLYYNRARYYDPIHGRFLSRDPIGYIDDVNPYRYVGNNPMMFSDPSGMFAKNPIVNGWNYLKNVGKSIVEGGVKGDYLNNPNGWNIVGQIGTGLTPAGVAGDIRDTSAAWKNCSGLGGCLGSLSLAGLGYIPGIGDLFKAGFKAGKKTDDVVKIGTKLYDGIKMNVDDALTAAEDFLGKGYKELSPGRFVSEIEGGFKQVRMGLDDILGKHGGGPHFNFETYTKNTTTGRMENKSNLHIYINE